VIDFFRVSSIPVPSKPAPDSRLPLPQRAKLGVDLTNHFVDCADLLPINWALRVEPSLPFLQYSDPVLQWGYLRTRSLLLDLYGPEAGMHARMAPGLATLPLGVPVTIAAEVAGRS
jgi:hypothetical protein